MPRLKLTIEYDGTGFRGWARQPAARTVEGELRRALAELYSTVQRADGRRADRHRRARARERRLGRCARRPAGRTSGPGVEHGPARRRRGDVRRGGAGRLQRPLRRAVEVVSLPHLAAARALRVRGEAVTLVAAAGRPRGAERQRPGAARRARLPGVHSRRDPAPRLRADGAARCSGSSWGKP